MADQEKMGLEGKEGVGNAFNAASKPDFPCVTADNGVNFGKSIPDPNLIVKALNYPGHEADQQWKASLPTCKP